MSLIEDMDDRWLKAALSKARQLLERTPVSDWLAYQSMSAHVASLESECKRRGLPTT